MPIYKSYLQILMYLFKSYIIELTIVFLLTTLTAFYFMASQIARANNRIQYADWPKIGPITSHIQDREVIGPRKDRPRKDLGQVFSRTDLALGY